MQLFSPDLHVATGSPPELFIMRWFQMPYGGVLTDERQQKNFDPGNYYPHAKLRKINGGNIFRTSVPKPAASLMVNTVFSDT